MTRNDDGSEIISVISFVRGEVYAERNEDCSEIGSRLTN